MSKHILIVEDETALGQGLRDALLFAGYRADLVRDGRTALRAIRAGGCDLVLLDLMLPELSGLEVLETLRAEGQLVPILILTALGAEEDRVRGLKMGADDYICKPFALRELIARVDAHLRRAQYNGELPGLPVLECDGIRADLRRLEVWRDGLSQPLTPREADLLAYLWRHADRAVSRDELLLEVWEYRTADVETRTVDATVALLRKKIERDTTRPRFILTARGRGYKLGEVCPR